MNAPRYLDKTKVIDYDEYYATVTAATSATTRVFKNTVKPGKQPWLSFISNAIQAGGGDLVTFRLLVNGSPWYPFDGSLNQWAPPESNYDLPVPYILPTGCTVEVIAINSDASNTYAATARVRIFYTDFEVNQEFYAQS
jgi:hypothetical protein